MYDIIHLRDELNIIFVNFKYVIRISSSLDVKFSV